MIEYVILLTASIALGAYGVWRARGYAIRMNWLDHPNERSFHENPTPRIGGWGLLLPVVFSCMLVLVLPGYGLSYGMLAILLPALAVALLSFFDDRHDLPRTLRLVVHVICGLAVLWLLRDAWMDKALPLGIERMPVILVGIILLLWIVGLTNAYNFMDGIDGIAAIQGMVAVAGWVMVLGTEMRFLPMLESLLVILLGILGGCIGFLIFNWSPASIFMGDTGSTFLGFFLAGLPLCAASMGLPMERSLEAAALFVWPFVFDTSITFSKRLLMREPVFDAHRSHLYQRFAATFTNRDSGHLWTGLLFGVLSILGIGLYRLEASVAVKLLILCCVWLAVLGWTHLRSLLAVMHSTRNGTVFEPVSDHVDYDIFLSPPEITRLEYAYVQKALDSNYVAPVGPQVNGFEQALAHYLDMQEVQAVSSGTAAIHLGLRGLGVGPGDCVLCPDLTFIASCNPIRYLGAEPVLVDVDPDTWAIDPELIKSAVKTLKSEGRNIRAMIVVHALGIPAPMQALTEIAEAENIRILEDCAGAFGTQVGGKSVGLFGDAAAYSFNGNKVLTTSGGGALYLKDASMREAARRWSNQGKRSGVIGYEHESIGYNYKLSNISAAIGLAQLETLQQRLKRKREVFLRYVENLAGDESIKLMPQPDYGTCNYWLSNFGFDSVDQAEAVLTALRKARIEASPLWKPMHRQVVNKDLRYFGNARSMEIHQRFVSLPSGTHLSNAQLDAVAAMIRKHLPVA